MHAKAKIALYWCSGCGGCEESVFDLAEGLLEVAEVAEIVFWPVAIDVRYRDLEAFGDGEIAASFINGAVRMEENVRMVKLLRRKSKLVVAHGSCAHLGGVVGLANFSTVRGLLKRSYHDMETIGNPSAEWPGGPQAGTGGGPPVSKLCDRVRALDQVVPVDYTIPGCPPPPDLLEKAMWRVVESDLPAKGSVLADQKALCHTCPRNGSRPETIRLKRFKRLFEEVWDPEICFLEQGLICAGPATRGGCGAQCIAANMPCRGCFGPLDKVSDQGSAILVLLASMIDSADENEVVQISDAIPDHAGLLYRYSTAVSILQGRVRGRSR